MRGKNRLRKQKIDLAVYDEHFEPHFVKDILLSDKDAINEVALGFTGPVSAIIINVNDHGYCKVRYDQKSLDSFVHSLQRINDPVTRAQVWRQLWLLVMDRKMSSLQFLDFVIKQIPYETVDQIIQVALMNLSGLVSYYIPIDHVTEKKRAMFDTLLHLLANENIEPTTKIPIVDNLFGFLSDIDHLKLAQQWLDTGVIFRDLATKRELFTLGQRHKYSILKRLFEEPSISTELKNQLLERTLGDDKSDIAQNTRDTCFALLPTAESKAQIWQQITDVNSTESIYKRAAKMGGFYSYKQIELTRPYFDQFYEVLPLIYEKQAFKYVESFFHSLLPRMEIKDEHIVKLLALKLQTPDNNTNFANLMNEGIELVIRSKNVREFAAKQ